MDLTFLIPMLLVVLAGIISFFTGFATPLLEILAGLVAGNFMAIESTEILHFLGEMGILSLMYLAGLEINVEFIKKEYKSSLSIGAAAFFAPFIAILTMSYFFLNFSMHQAILTSIALSTTAVAIIYPILLKRGRIEGSAKGLLAAAMITDLLSIVALSLFFSDFTIYTLIILVGLFVLAKPIRSLGHMLFGKLQKESLFALELKTVLLIILGLQFLASIAGVDAVLFAFIFGILTSELLERFDLIEKQLKTITFAFLTPFFFFNVGLTIDLPTFFQAIGLMLLFTVVVYTTKFLGTWTVSRWFYKKQAVFAGNLFNSALSIGIIAATLGLEEGLFTTEIYIAVIGTVILCSFISALTTHQRFTLEG
jgi:glutathione-regulated potassium-efflux system ancillary protein KefC